MGVSGGGTAFLLQSPDRAVSAERREAAGQAVGQERPVQGPSLKLTLQAGETLLGQRPTPILL